ncbi:MAG: radical SAM protein [Spirochaetales bacterium]|nr:radical SAM protein [Spirochaetales bacterium]
MKISNRKLLRIIIPRFPNFNIYTLAARTTTSVGPLYAATSATKLDCWDAEVIDENNLHGRFYPRTENGGLDHAALQSESPAAVVGFYGSITSSVPRLYELAKMYKKSGCVTIAGGKHIENMPEEALANGIDYVFHEEAEISIRNFLMAFDNPAKRELVKGISFIRNGTFIKNPAQALVENLDALPVPDYNLLRFAKMKLYPICGTRGCNSNCEFCAVKGRARNCSADTMMNEIKLLVEKYGARKFFDVSDHFAANMKQAIRFLDLFADYQESIGKRLYLSIQTRITDARSDEYLAALKRAMVDIVCIGFESPVDENLLAMNKGYRSKDMLDWTRKFKRQKVRIHGMFIFGYPGKDKQVPGFSLTEHVREYRRFIRKSNIDTLQLLLAIPLPGTELRTRLENEGRLFPVETIGWEYYDGQYPLFDPGEGIRPEELQQAAGKIVKKFYGISFFFRIIKNILFDFPLIVFPSVFTLPSGKIRYIRKAFSFWYHRYYQNNLLRFGGLILVKNWFRQFRKGVFMRKLYAVTSA